MSNTENFIKTINSENNITKYFTIKDLKSTFNVIGNPFSLFHLNINSLSFHFDELESLISKSKNDFQIIGISETRLKKTQETTTNIQLENFEHVPTESVNGAVLLYINVFNLVTAFLIFSLSLKYGIKRTSSLFYDVFYKHKENSSLDMTVFDKFSC